MLVVRYSESIELKKKKKKKKTKRLWHFENEFFVKNMFLNFSFIFNKSMNDFISQPLHVVFDNIKSDNIVDEWILIQS